MLHVACCLWDANEKTQDFSRCFNESWVEKLYRGFKRNLTVPFKFVLFTDRGRRISKQIDQRRLSSDVPDYGSMIDPFVIEAPLIVCGLDTVVVGNVDHLARYCETATRIALPRDPYQPERSINPIVLAPKKSSRIYHEFRGSNDMDHLRKYPWQPIDDLFPNQVLSLKFHKIRDVGLPNSARMVYFHGRPKPHELTHLPWVQEHWK